MTTSNIFQDAKYYGKFYKKLKNKSLLKSPTFLHKVLSGSV
jgi:hypothetical protein